MFVPWCYMHSFIWMIFVLTKLIADANLVFSILSYPLFLHYQEVFKVHILCQWVCIVSLQFEDWILTMSFNCSTRSWQSLSWYRMRFFMSLAIIFSRCSTAFIAVSILAISSISLELIWSFVGDFSNPGSSIVSILEVAFVLSLIRSPHKLWLLGKSLSLDLIYLSVVPNYQCWTRWSHGSTGWKPVKPVKRLNVSNDIMT